MRTLVMMTAVGLAASAAAGCDKPKETMREAPVATTTAAVAAPPTPLPSGAAPAAPAAVVELAIASVGDTMAFDKKELTVPAGATVHVTLKNNGTMAAMTHNWVLVKTGTEASVALAGLEKAPDAGFVVPGPDVLAFTPLAAPKQAAEVTFTAPAPGKYPYVCTFPGHYLLMKGVLTVTL